MPRHNLFQTVCKEIDSAKSARIMKEASEDVLQAASKQPLEKEAGWVDTGAKVTLSAMDRLRWILLGLPAALGMGAGAIVSKATSPSKKTIQTAQQKIVLSELDEALAESRRLRDISLAEEKRKENEGSSRSLRI